MKIIRRINPLNLLAFAHDVAAVAITWALAYLLRFNFELPPDQATGFVASLLCVVPLYAAVFWQFDLYRGLWRYASLQDLQRIILAVAVAAPLTVAVLALISPTPQVPRAVMVLNPLLLVLLMGGSRIAYRLFKEYLLYGHARILGEPVIVVGAGERTHALMRELATNLQWHVVGIVDDEKAMQGRSLAGVKVMAGVARLPALARRLHVHNVIIALPGSTASARRRAIEIASKAGLAVHSVPTLPDLLSGRVAISELRKVELEDLLGREEVELDTEGLHQFLTGKTVMVTGAGGSIGSELCRQILGFEPECLLMLEANEFALYTIDEEFRCTRGGSDGGVAKTRIVPLIGDVRDRERIARLLAQHRPETIFHAAAYKHVPLMEDENAPQAVNNNARGTLALGEEAIKAGVGKFVLVSTDKAVRPTNVMGASKRLAEIVCQSLNVKNGTRFVIVRFGNVLGSTGSVIPKFREQIARGGPVTVTDPEITRYFMTIPEAAQLVLQAGMMGSGGEIFVLDMGEPVKIVDLARDMIRLSGLGEDDIAIEYTGLRPGEKLYEEPLADHEQTLPTRHPKLRIALAAPAVDGDTETALRVWLQNPPADVETLKKELGGFVPEYKPFAFPPSAIEP